MGCELVSQRARTSHWLMGEREETNDDQSARSPQARIYGQYTYESVMVLGSAVSRLLRKNPSALSVLKTDQIAEYVFLLTNELVFLSVCVTLVHALQCPFLHAAKCVSVCTCPAGGVAAP
ncbi:unnamed protein product [Dibothriocephalus latus]|uniref:Uncharacterized protein n=1 Tax=Dibothriocephalus latus TaxID=60516 RepID=A0A3P7NGN6_DIBLA|nr:unnamed protein product [Dibothriocephalus latus]